jgi:uncharacterized membrane protein (UPF0127 family)
MRSILLAGGALVLAGILIFFALSRPPYSLAHIERVDTPAAREQGLSGRTEIPEDYGMLFVFPDKGDYGFWMKDMKVSIDVFWLSDDGTIVGIERALSPDTYPEAVHPPLPVRYVLETRSGTGAARGWTVGTTLALPLR